MINSNRGESYPRTVRLYDLPISLEENKALLDLLRSIAFQAANATNHSSLLYAYTSRILSLPAEPPFRIFCVQ